jgi:hypothetical protein
MMWNREARSWYPSRRRAVTRRKRLICFIGVDGERRERRERG